MSVSVSLLLLFCLSRWSLCLFQFSIVMFDDYKTVIWAASLMSGWLLRQPVAMSICCCHFIVFCLLHSDK